MSSGGGLSSAGTTNSNAPGAGRPAAVGLTGGPAVVGVVGATPGGTGAPLWTQLWTNTLSGSNHGACDNFCNPAHPVGVNWLEGLARKARYPPVSRGAPRVCAGGRSAHGITSFVRRKAVWLCCMEKDKSGHVAQDAAQQTGRPRRGQAGPDKDSLPRPRMRPHLCGEWRPGGLLAVDRVVLLGGPVGQGRRGNGGLLFLGVGAPRKKARKRAASPRSSDRKNALM